MTRNISIEPHGFRVRRRAAMAMSRVGLRSLRDRGVCVRVIRGCRSAQPPANGWHPSGMAPAAQAGALPVIERWCGRAAQARGLKAISRWLHAEPGGFQAISRWSRSIATTPPVARRTMSRIPEGCQRRATLAARVDEHLKKMGAVWK